MTKEKDIAEKLLFEAEDVFADILNVLLFEGEEVILPHTLNPTSQRSQLKIEGALHEQERDVSKIWMGGGVRFALFGLENQTEAEPDMVLRVFSYDGASYKEQVIHNRQAGTARWLPYPVVTVVLYFGRKRWNSPKTLKSLLGDRISSKLEPFVNDYKLHVFEISYLSPEKVAMFKSDFRIVADFFTQTCRSNEYVPNRETIVHVEETLKLMAVLTGDSRFAESAHEAVMKGVPVSMCDVLDRAENRGIQKGRAEGRLNTLYELALDGVLSHAEAAVRANLPEQEFIQRAEEYRRRSEVGRSRPLAQSCDLARSGAERALLYYFAGKRFAILLNHVRKYDIVYPICACEWERIPLSAMSGDQAFGRRFCHGK